MPAVVAQKFSVGRYVLEPQGIEWEAAMLAGGLDVLDRRSMTSVERELFLQEASFAKAGAAVTEALALRDPATGVRWHESGDTLRPLANGSRVPASERLSTGQVVSAEGLLEVGQIKYSSRDLGLSGRQPTSHAVAYRPRLRALMQPLVVGVGHWASSDAEPFRYDSSDAAIYFDREVGALRQPAQLLLSCEVTRGRYIARRSTVEEFHCPECERRIPEKDVREAPDEDVLPAQWTCEACQSVGPVRYFDGFRVDESVGGNRALLRWRWVEPRAGIYPVLPSQSLAGDRQILLLPDSQMNSERVATLLHGEDVLGAQLTDWCLVDGSGRAVLLSGRALAVLRECLGVDADGKLPVPSVDDRGQQVWELSSALHRDAELALPVETAEVAVRVVRTTDSRVLCAGTISLSYLNLLASAQTLTVGVEGLDLDAWPSREDQRRELASTLRRRLVELLSTSR